MSATLEAWSVTGGLPLLRSTPSSVATTTTRAFPKPLASERAWTWPGWITSKAPPTITTFGRRLPAGVSSAEPSVTVTSFLADASLSAERTEDGDAPGLLLIVLTRAFPSLRLAT